MGINRLVISESFKQFRHYCTKAIPNELEDLKLTERSLACTNEKNFTKMCRLKYCPRLIKEKKIKKGLSK